MRRPRRSSRRRGGALMTGEATIGRQFGVVIFDGRVRHKTWLWSYGQAMNAAVRIAEQQPDAIVFLQTRGVIYESWQEPDFDAEEAMSRAKRDRLVSSEEEI